MEIKDQNIETATDAEGHEYIAEIDATMTDVSADGTVSVAEMTTTANPDDPTDVEGHMTVTETETDGTETVTEYVSNEDGVFKVEEDSAFENAVEAIFGVEIEDDLTQVMDADGNPVGELAENTDVYVAETDPSADDNTDIYVTDPDSAPVSVEFNLGDEEFSQTDLNFDSSDTLVSDESFEPTIETVDLAYDPNEELSVAGVDDSTNETGLTEEENQETLDQQAHSEAATDAQQAADDFIDKGDYAAAAEARETAENEAWEAGDDSMLGASDAQDLSNAADKQDDAAYYEQQEAEHAQAGDYEAAKEDAGNAAYAMSDADYNAGGDDHTGQAKLEESNMDNAIWHEGLADDQIENAEWHAEMGNTDAADAALDSAASEQATADDFGDRGEHGAVGADYDVSSEVETGGSYESTYDDNVADIDTGFDANVDAGYDSGMDAIDTGYDAGADMAVDTGFDSGMETSIDTGYDSGTDDV